MPDLTTKDALLERMVTATENLAVNVPKKFDDYLSLSGGTLTGLVEGITPSAEDKSKNLATTEFVHNNYTPSYSKRGNAPSITVPEGTYILIAYGYGFSVPSPNNVYVGLLGGGDFNDGTEHINVVDILKGANFAALGLSYSITTNGTKKITISLALNNSNISLIKVWADV